MLKVGYIGLGLMGKPIARNILKAGFPLVVHNRSRSSVSELVMKGAKEAFSPAEVASQVDVIFTNLPDSPDVESVVLGETLLLCHISLFALTYVSDTIDELKDKANCLKGSLEVDDDL